MTSEAIIPYPAFFRTMIGTLSRQSLEAVESASYSLSVTVRDQALHVLNFAMQWDGAWSLASKLLLALAPKMELMGHRHDWIPYLKWGAEQAEQRGELQIVAECQLQIGLLYRMLSEFGIAQSWVKTSIDHFKTGGERRGQARALNELAWIEHLQHRFADANIHAEAALSLLDETDLERGMSFRVKGMITHVQGQWAEAETYHRQALDCFIRRQNERIISWGLQNLANAIRRQARYAEAIPLFQSALSILDQLEDRYHWAMVQMNLGATLCDSQLYERSLYHFQQAREIFDRLNDKINVANVDTGTGLCYQGLKQYSHSERSFLSSAQQFAELGYLNWQLNALDGLAKTYCLDQKYTASLQVIDEALIRLPTIIDAPNYNYLLNSIQMQRNEILTRQGQHVHDPTCQNQVREPLVD